MILDAHLDRRDVNHQPLTPLLFLDRALDVFSDRTAAEWRGQTFSYAAFGEIVLRMMDDLEQQGVSHGDVVTFIAPNRIEMLAAHFAVPAVGAVLNALNPRLHHDAVSYILDHSQSRLLIADPSCAEMARIAAKEAQVDCLLLCDAAGDGGYDPTQGATPAPRDLLGNVYDEWQPIALNYTSGTTGKPKGAVYHHRGAYLNALGNLVTLGFDQHTRYLWTLPLFHCNGWCHGWAVTAAGGAHICLEKVDPEEIFNSISTHDVTHMACAPVVLYMILDHPSKNQRNPTSTQVRVASGGAAPSSTLIANMELLAFEFIHLYGLTETFGPTSARILKAAEADLSSTEKAARLSAQGYRHITANRLRVLDPDGKSVPRDGQTVGEIALCGSTVMAGYYRDQEETEKAFRNGFFLTGDLAVMHSTGEIEIRDRSKDVIISGGENVSSVEVENVLQMHPAVRLAAVVAAPDEKWGEIPFAFVELSEGAETDGDELIAFCRKHLAGFKLPKMFVFRALPRTATGKVQKFELRDEARMIVTAP